MMPAEIAAITRTQQYNVTVPNNGGIIIQPRVSRTLLFVSTNSMVITNHILTPGNPKVAGQGIVVQSQGLLLPFHEWGGTLQNSWFMFQSSGGSIDYFVLESWVDG